MKSTIARGASTRYQGASWCAVDRTATSLLSDRYPHSEVEGDQRRDR
jgi:hypothetical protein